MIKRVLIFSAMMAVAMLVIFLAIVLGDHGPWYFAWLLGTATIVLVAAAGGAMFDAQEAHEAEKHSDASS